MQIINACLLNKKKFTPLLFKFLSFWYQCHIIFYKKEYTKQQNNIGATRDEINKECGRGKALEKIEMASMENCR